MRAVAGTIGFVAKEAVLSSLLEGVGSLDAVVPLVGIVLGSILTTAYGLRFIWGAFWTKKDAEGAALPVTAWPDPPIGFLAAPVVLAGLDAPQRVARLAGQLCAEGLLNLSDDGYHLPR